MILGKSLRIDTDQLEEFMFPKFITYYIDKDDDTESFSLECILKQHM